MGVGRKPAACAAAVAVAHAAQAAFTIFAGGSPVQEGLAYTLARRPGAVGIGLCTGAALRFAAGTLPRAPAWMRRHGLEWLHRLGQEPLRLAGRYFLASPPALLALAWSARPQKGG
jgi:exopolysaccharide biosynthesis WecB/TagA/CpsF family protein